MRCRVGTLLPDALQGSAERVVVSRAGLAHQAEHDLLALGLGHAATGAPAAPGTGRAGRLWAGGGGKARQRTVRGFYCRSLLDPVSARFRCLHAAPTHGGGKPRPIAAGRGDGQCNVLPLVALLPSPTVRRAAGRLGAAAAPRGSRHLAPTLGCCHLHKHDPHPAPAPRPPVPVRRFRPAQERDRLPVRAAREQQCTRGAGASARRQRRLAAALLAGG